MTFDGIRRLSPYWNLALLLRRRDGGHSIPVCCMAMNLPTGCSTWLILPVSALLCTFRAAYRALPRYGLMPVLVGLWAIVLPLATFRSTEMQSLFYGLVPSLVGLTLGVLVRKFVFWYRNR